MSADPREEVWREAFMAAMTGGAGPDGARNRAKEALQIYEQEWPFDRPEVVVAGGTIDYSMLKNACAALKEDMRFDAYLVLKDFANALLDAQRKGQKLSAWGPPPRGTEIA